MKDLFQRTMSYEKIHNPRILRSAFYDHMRSCVLISVQDDVVRMASDLLDSTVGGVSRVAPFFHLPYDRVFLQWRAAAQYNPSDGPQVEGIYYPEFHGVMLERLGAEHARIINADPDDVIVQSVIQIDDFAIPNPMFALCSREDLAKAPSDAKVASRKGDSPFYFTMPVDYPNEARERDMNAELVITPWLLAIINSPNLTARKTIPRSTSPTVSFPHGQLIKHHVVKLNLSRGLQRRMGCDGDGAAAAKRLHTVRGHFKIRKTGIFWWSDFWRGDAKSGEVTKSYEVAA